MFKRILLIVFLLTVADAVCTAAGLRLGAITEGNPLMAAPMYAAPGITAAAVYAGTDCRGGRQGRTNRGAGGRACRAQSRTS